MRIGIDARELTGRRTGVGRYLGHLLDEWAADADATPARHEWVFFAPRPLDPHFQRATQSLGARIAVLPGGGGTVWEQMALASAVNRGGVDVLFAPAYTAPLRARCPVVLTLHDVSFLAHPEWFRPRERLRRAWVTRRSAAKAARVVTVSEFSRTEILRLTGVPGDRIRVILHGRPRTAAGTGTRDAGDPLVLYVGSLFNRRRLPDLVLAFQEAAAAIPGARLAIVGEDRTWPRQDIAGACRRSGVADRIDLLEYVADDRLAALYGRARCFAFLSEYEGFGLTPLEALAHGVPPVLLDTPVARETCGPAAAYVAGGDTRGTAQAMIRLLSDEGSRNELLSHAEGVLGRYSWERAARETLATIEDAAR